MVGFKKVVILLLGLSCGAVYATGVGFYIPKASNGENSVTAQMKSKTCDSGSISIEWASNWQLPLSGWQYSIKQVCDQKSLKSLSFVRYVVNNYDVGDNTFTKNIVAYYVVDGGLLPQFRFKVKLPTDWYCMVESTGGYPGLVRCDQST